MPQPRTKVLTKTYCFSTFELATTYSVREGRWLVPQSTDFYDNFLASSSTNLPLTHSEHCRRNLHPFLCWQSKDPQLFFVFPSGMCQCQADTATRPRLARHGPARLPTWPDMVRHRSAWRGLAWLIELRGLAITSEAQALSIKVRGLEGRAGPGPVDKSEGLGGRAG